MEHLRFLPDEPIASNTFLLALLPEREGDCCPDCHEPAVERTCTRCGLTGWVIDCGHQAQPRPLAPGKSDGTSTGRIYCAICAEL